MPWGPVRKLENCVSMMDTLLAREMGMSLARPCCCRAAGPVPAAPCTTLSKAVRENCCEHTSGYSGSEYHANVLHFSIPNFPAETPVTTAHILQA